MTTAPETIASILSRADEGEPVAAIAESLSVTPGVVYGVLREHRPERTRSPRKLTSEKRPMVLGLLGAGIKPSRVAELAGVTRQYVYRIKEDSKG